MWVEVEGRSKIVVCVGGSAGEEQDCCECVWVEVEGKSKIVVSVWVEVQGRSKIVVSVCGWKWRGGARLL